MAKAHRLLTLEAHQARETMDFALAKIVEESWEMALVYRCFMDSEKAYDRRYLVGRAGVLDI